MRPQENAEIRTDNAPETTVASTVPTPKGPRVPKSSTITLTAPGGTPQIVAERKGDSARSYVLTTDSATKKTTRGMTENHPTFEAAKTAIETSAAKAEKLGWKRKVATRKFVARPDAFSSLPAAPEAAPVAQKSGKKG